MPRASLRPARRFHTFGIRFPIDVLFVNRQGHVVKQRADMPRGRLTGALRAFAVIELAAGAIDRVGVRKGDQLLDTHAATPSTSR
jgi:uncharacterized membrane protein (UPF0127 family)